MQFVSILLLMEYGFLDPENEQYCAEVVFVSILLLMEYGFLEHFLYLVNNQ